MGTLIVIALPTYSMPYFFLATLLAFLQECFQSGVDTDCTPEPSEGFESFPLDGDHGFGVVHDTVWDGSAEDPLTGLCSQGMPDSKGRRVVSS